MRRQAARSGYPSSKPSTFLDLPTGDESVSAARFASQGYSQRQKQQPPWFVRVVENFVKASIYTKASYGWLFSSVIVTYLGFRGIRHGHASIRLTCNPSACDLEIIPPGPPNITKIRILREQLVKAEVVKVDKQGNIMQVVGSKDEIIGGGVHRPRRHTVHKKPKGKKYSNEALGPDENGWYDSYVLVVAEHGPDPEDNINGREDIGGIAGHHMEKNSDGGEENYKKQIHPRGRHPTNTLEPLQEFVKPDENGSYTFQMRRFNVGQSRRKASSTATRINSFARKRRHKLSVTETMTVPWQAIVAIVVGMFSLIVSLLVGQLWDPEPQRRAVGHVAKGNQRRPNPHNAAGRRAPPAAAGLYGHRHQANR